MNIFPHSSFLCLERYRSVTAVFPSPHATFLIIISIVVRVYGSLVRYIVDLVICSLDIATMFVSSRMIPID
ncbi:hypothetical protein NEOLEDRAFT_554483 [Neolentinus lepideus HHB14362 ss-1]|uniref:Uncharacterized protein n=1 Tax=Neolentinus lepideus HHB14362 ss-1 TaxID=1314782 RepID=A0A165R4X4_9AGAM|nr:hypothetical protein NEOLEDRAFT_554483 [Neolentinus lepideus HHB14362 ss-1]